MTELCENCNENDAEYEFVGTKCCYECLREELQDNALEEIIEQYIEQNARKIE